MTKKEVIEFNYGNITTGLSGKGYGHAYFARKDFKKGSVVMRGIGRIVDHQTSHCSVQIGHKKHYVPTKWTGRYWNHSCDPNTHIRTRADGFPDLVALRNIRIGEEINYSYAMTEFEWIKTADEVKIKCKCKAKNCKGKIRAFSHLPKNEQVELLESRLCSKYLFNVASYGQKI